MARPRPPDSRMAPAFAGRRVSSTRRTRSFRPGSPPDVATRPVLAPGRGDRIIDSGVVAAPRSAARHLCRPGRRARRASPERARSVAGARRPRPIRVAVRRGDWPQLLQQPRLVRRPVGRASPGGHWDARWQRSTRRSGLVMVAPPDLRTQVSGVVTLYDVMLQVIDRGDGTVPARPRFWQDIHSQCSSAPRTSDGSTTARRGRW